MAEIVLNPCSLDDYRKFLAIKQLPTWQIHGRRAVFPDEYANAIGVSAQKSSSVKWTPSSFLFDYQRDILQMALQKKKYSVFADCGLGKTLIQLEFAQASIKSLKRRKQGFLIVAPLMVISQTLSEAARWYPDLQIDGLKAVDLPNWLKKCQGRIGITNYESFRTDFDRGQLGGLILDESSMLKSHYGKWGTRLLKIGRGLEFKMCGTGTPAPNDRIEYANSRLISVALGGEPRWDNSPRADTTGKTLLRIKTHSFKN